MIFGDRSLSELTLNDFLPLVENHVPEGPYLEYKERAYSGRPQDIREMLRDISAFANANGGYIIMGIQEDNLGRAIAITPIENPNIQAIRLACLDGILERIQGLEIQPYFIEGDSGIIVIRIPSSKQRPHMMIRDSSTDFMRRYGTDKRPMTLGEIRDNFLSNQTYRRLIELELIAQSQIRSGSEIWGEISRPYIQIYTDRSVEKFLQRYFASSVRAQALVIISPFIGDLSGEQYSLANVLKKVNTDKTAVYIITQEPYEEYHRAGLAILESSPWVEIRYNPGIHAKLYICWSREEEQSFALFGSGNLTTGGIRHNIELGMMVLSRGYGRHLVRDLYRWGSHDLRVDINSKRIKAIGSNQ